MSFKKSENKRRMSKHLRKEDICDVVERTRSKRMEGYRESTRNEMKRRQVNNNASPSPSDSTESEANEKVKRSSRKLKNDTTQEMSKIQTKMDKLKIKHDSYANKLRNLSTNSRRRYANDTFCKEGSSIDHSYVSSSYKDEDAPVSKRSGIKGGNVSFNSHFNQNVDSESEDLRAPSPRMGRGKFVGSGLSRRGNRSGGALFRTPVETRRGGANLNNYLQPRSLFGFAGSGRQARGGGLVRRPLRGPRPSPQDYDFSDFDTEVDNDDYSGAFNDSLPYEEIHNDGGAGAGAQAGDENPEGMDPGADGPISPVDSFERFVPGGGQYRNPDYNIPFMDEESDYQDSDSETSDEDDGNQSENSSSSQYTSDTSGF